MKSFLTDKDGVSERDYLLLASTTVFFLFVAVGLVLVLMGRTLDAMYVTLLEMVAPVLMTITGGVFGVRAVQEYRKSPQKSEEEAADYDSRV